MTYKILSHKLVKKDLKDAAMFYAKISIKLADQFLDEVTVAKDFLRENPYANDIMYEDIRQHLLKKFPYHLHYMIEEESKSVVILAITFAKKGNIKTSRTKK